MMTDEAEVTPPAASGMEAPKPTVHQAELASGTSGGVLRGAEIDQADAIARRRGGANVVVSGDDLKANRNLARDIEAAVGP